MKYDFHVHSTFSDSDIPFDESVEIAIKNNVDFLGMADHDTLEPVRLANTAKYKSLDISVIGAVEISSFDFEYNNTVHVLSYGCDIQNKKLINIVDSALKRRNENFIKIINQINQNEPIKINIDKIISSHPCDSIYEITIKRYLFNYHGITPDDSLFKKIFSKGGYINYDVEYFDYREVIDAVKQSGGIPILAHAFATNNFDNVDDLMKAGIMGMEARHPFHSIDEENAIINYCENNDLLITCGSDYHGKYVNRGAGIGDCSLSDELMKPFISALKSRSII